MTYGSPSLSATFRDKSLYVVGGANSAGQAVTHLAKQRDCTVHLFVRGKSIEEKMSKYLVDRINACDNVQVHLETEVESIGGRGRVETVHVRTPEGIWVGAADQIS